MAAPLTPASSSLARAARERFVAHLEGVLAPLGDAIRAQLAESVDSAGTTREMYDRRDAFLDFEQARQKWVEGTRSAWRRAVLPPTATARVRMDLQNLELIGDDVVENKILSSRLAMAAQEKAVWDLNELKLRIQHLEGGDDLASDDVLRPEAVAQILVEQWAGAGLKRDAWTLVKDLIHARVAERMVEAYHRTNEFLVSQGVLRDIDLSARVKRPPAAGRRAAGAAGGESGPGGLASQPGGMAGADDSFDGAGPGGAGRGGAGRRAGRGEAGAPRTSGWGEYDGASAPGQGAAYGGGGGGGVGGHGGVADETRMLTGTTPLARARARASGVLGQLRRLLTDKVAGFDGGQAGTASPQLAAAIAQHAIQVQTQVHTQVHTQVQGRDGGEIVVFDDSDVEEIAGDLRRRTTELKKKATTSSEKATIEIVALMFQAILAEERIPPAVRVWFARLQMPVLRVAIAEPEFFGSLEHPARQLIDRMGSCVLGFDASAITGSALEAEIKRVVQVIEQYPETGRRVFQLVYEEFQRFLSRFLTEKGSTQRLVSVAQQVEQKETMAIQYTIELRKMLSDVPVREEIREFLFKVWAEVLAVAGVKHGRHHEETVQLKQCAADLVWAASAKPNRVERARVIQDLPRLLTRLRQGMALLGLDSAVQEEHIKVIGDTLADAFQSKTEAIPQARIDEMAKRLANLEDFVEDEPGADLPLDKESIELMLGIDTTLIEVIADGGSAPSAAMLAWAQELQVGNWFSLDHNGKPTQVQYVWRSERRQLHLFASPDGRSFLIQVRRLAAYLQAGLLVPNEEEALTVRATRDALAKLDANPERLFD